MSDASDFVGKKPSKFRQPKNCRMIKLAKSIKNQRKSSKLHLLVHIVEVHIVALRRWNSGDTRCICHQKIFHVEYNSTNQIGAERILIHSEMAIKYTKTTKVHCNIQNKECSSVGNLHKNLNWRCKFGVFG